jgi:hypothetical protein
MKQTRTGKRREAAINSVKILLTSASLAATVGGWAVISASGGAAVNVAQVDSTATVQAFLDSRSTTVVGTTATPAASATAATVPATAASTNENNSLAAGNTIAAASATSAPTATVAPTATAVPTRVVVQRVIRTRSSR